MLIIKSNEFNQGTVTPYNTFFVEDFADLTTKTDSLVNKIIRKFIFEKNEKKLFELQNEVNRNQETIKTLVEEYDVQYDQLNFKIMDGYSFLPLHLRDKEQFLKLAKKLNEIGDKNDLLFHEVEKLQEMESKALKKTKH